MIYKSGKKMLKGGFALERNVKCTIKKKSTLGTLIPLRQSQKIMNIAFLAKVLSNCRCTVANLSF